MFICKVVQRRSHSDDLEMRMNEAFVFYKSVTVSTMLVFFSREKKR